MRRYTFLAVLICTSYFCLGSMLIAFMGFPKLMKVEVDLKSSLKVDAFFESGLDIATVTPEGYAHVLVRPEDYEWIKSLGFYTTVLVEDVYVEFYEQHGYLGDGNLSDYHNYEQTVAALNSYRSTYPNLTKLETIGQSLEGRNIYALKISDNPTIEDPTEPDVLFVGVHHAREPITVEICLALIDYLLKNYSSNPTVKAIVDNREIWVVPIQNPDGFVYVDLHDPYWRKNRRGDGYSVWGVDTNRNYAYKWGWDNYGSSPNKYDETYRGASALSEPECLALHNFGLAHDFVTSCSHHSYGDYILWPWGYTAGQPTYWQVLDTHAQAMSAMNGYTDGQTSKTLYMTNGDFLDNFYGNWNTICYTIESGSDFWPPKYQHQALINESLNPDIYLCQKAGNVFEPMPPVTPRILPMGYDPDGNYTVTWTNGDPGHFEISDKYELVEMEGYSRIVDNLENGSTNWALSKFSLSTARYHSSSHSFYGGMSHMTTATATAVNPIIVNSGDQVTFWTYYAIEKDWDYAYVEVSDDGGLNFKTIPGNITTNYNPNGTNEGNGITGSSGGWIQGTFSLSTYVGKSIVLRFKYQTDQATIEEGFYVDDITPVETFTKSKVLSSAIPDTFYAITGKATGTYYYKVRGADSQGQWSAWSNIEDMIVGGYDITVDCTPDNISVPKGQNMNFSVQIKNNGSSKATFDVWADVLLPNGKPYSGNPVQGPFSITLQAGATLNKNAVQPIPGNAPTGNYQYIVKAGFYPDSELDNDIIYLTVTN